MTRSQMHSTASLRHVYGIALLRRSRKAFLRLAIAAVFLLVVSFAPR